MPNPNDITTLRRSTAIKLTCRFIPLISQAPPATRTKPIRGLERPSLQSDRHRRSEQGRHHEGGVCTLKVANLTDGETADYQWDTAILEVSKNGKSLGILEPTRRFYKIAQQGTAEVALRTRLNEDLYINYAARVGDKATLQAYVFPWSPGSGWESSC